MDFKEVMGTLSPAYGMIKGEGMFGNAGLGVLPAMAANMRKKKKDGTKMSEAEMVAEAKGPGMKKGGKVKKYAKGGSVSSASKRADGCCIKGKTKGKMV